VHAEVLEAQRGVSLCDGREEQSPAKLTFVQRHSVDPVEHKLVQLDVDYSGDAEQQHAERRRWWWKKRPLERTGDDVH
jgi:hypothetical protein